MSIRILPAAFAAALLGTVALPGDAAAQSQVRPGMTPSAPSSPDVLPMDAGRSVTPPGRSSMGDPGGQNLGAAPPRPVGQSGTGAESAYPPNQTPGTAAGAPAMGGDAHGGTMAASPATPPAAAPPQARTQAQTQTQTQAQTGSSAATVGSGTTGGMAHAAPGTGSAEAHMSSARQGSVSANVPLGEQKVDFYRGLWVPENPVPTGIGVLSQRGDLVGQRVFAAGGQPIGMVEHLLIDPGSDRVRYAIVSRPGEAESFLAVPVSAMRMVNNQVTVNATPDVISRAPRYQMSELQEKFSAASGGSTEPRN